MAPLLGVLLTAIGAFFVYRKSEGDRERGIKQAASVGIVSAPLQAQADLKALTDNISMLNGLMTRLISMLETHTQKQERERELRVLIDELRKTHAPPPKS